MSFKESLVKSASSRNVRTDIKRLTPHSLYYRTEEFYREKLGDRLPDELYQYLELEAQLSKQNQEVNAYHLNYINSIKEDTINEYNRLMNEFKEREEEGKDDSSSEVSIPENYFIAK